MASVLHLCYSNHQHGCHHCLCPVVSHLPGCRVNCRLWSGISRTLTHFSHEADLQIWCHIKIRMWSRSRLQRSSHNHKPDQSAINTSNTLSHKQDVDVNVPILPVFVMSVINHTFHCRLKGFNQYRSPLIIHLYPIVIPQWQMSCILSYK